MGRTFDSGTSVDWGRYKKEEVNLDPAAVGLGMVFFGMIAFILGILTGLGLAWVY